MFVVYLDPLGPRKAPATQLWQFYKLLSRTNPQEVHFLLTEPYLEDPDCLSARHAVETSPAAVEKYGYPVPTSRQVSSASASIFPEGLFTPLLERFGMIDQAWATLLTDVYEPLYEYLAKELNQLSKRNIEGVITWANNASLEKAASELNIPVIHNEVGPLRAPVYQDSAYFDLRGVNGNTDSSRRYADFIRHFEIGDPGLLSRKEILQTILKPAFAASFSQTFGSSPQFEAGVALQVEDDSNILAYAGSWNSRSLVSYVLSHHTADQTTVRNHPLSSFPFVSSTVGLDNSPSSFHFVESCQTVFTINSSVGIEALLLGRNSRFFGQNPASFWSADSGGGSRAESDTARFLNFLCFNYLIPDSLLFDFEYYRWRLTRPTEKQIWARHRALWPNISSVVDPFTKSFASGTGIMSKLLLWCNGGSVPFELHAWVNTSDGNLFSTEFDLSYWHQWHPDARIDRVKWIPAAGKQCTVVKALTPSVEIVDFDQESDGSKAGRYFVGPTDGVTLAGHWSDLQSLKVAGEMVVHRENFVSTGGSAELGQRMANLETHAQNLESHLAAVHQTLSWRITAPLRALRRFRKV